MVITSWWNRSTKGDQTMQTLIWPFALLLATVLLVFLEIFVPSGGLLGLLAAVALMASIGLAFVQSMADGAIVLLVDLLVLPLVIAIAIKVWPHTPLGKLILLKRPGDDEDILPDTEEYHLREKMLGKRGVARTPLLPSGDVAIENRVYDAVSDGVPIEVGQRVVVVAVRTQRLVVRPLSAQELGEFNDAEAADDILATPIDSLGIDPMDDPLA